ncbi:putative caffeine resistance protein [Leucosporidium creatinivorum]|uniref:Putative caffeine resistance protein n=1 Tax=Leucosporidium creatinivorum TaxID=106004 RepID=A0A1Y2ENY3_9BASI|nr:putative caffeine resistance protein [Leucosporidium creatinivorum]
MLHLVRESAVGQILNWASKGRILPYPDQRADYVVPSKYLKGAFDSQAPTLNASTSPRPPADVNTLVDAEGVVKKTESQEGAAAGDLEKGSVDPELPPEIAAYPFLVEFDENDPDNPRNWPKWQRNFVAALVCFLTFSVYVGSAIYTSSIPDIMVTFGVSQVVATLGLTLFILGYGIGPMFLAPIQEMPHFGRNPVYIAGLFLFVLFQVPVIFAKNIGTILVFRFLAGFVGSPALATGGASLMDIFPMESAGTALAVWALGAVFGPIFGPVVGGFAAQANGWRWPIYELLWISGASLLLLAFFLPETLGSTILLRRAERLRKLTGNEMLKTQTELDATADETILDVAWLNFVRAFQLSAEPAILFANVYIGLLYAIFYLWFEAFPLVFGDIYHFNLGLSSTPFLGFVVTGFMTFAVYLSYNKYYFNPRMMTDPNFQPEARLELGVPAALTIPISLFMFGWGARESVHWIVPIIGASLYFPGVFIAFQVCLNYLAMIYPQYAASIFAGNDLFRSTFASVFPLFGAAFFKRLGLGGGSSLLAGLNILMIPLLMLLIKYGARLRAQSKWTPGH